MPDFSGWIWVNEYVSGRTNLNLKKKKVFSLSFSIYLGAWSITVKCLTIEAQKETLFSVGERYRFRKMKSGLLHCLCIKIRSGNRKKLFLLTRFFLLVQSESHLNLKLALK